MFANCHDVAAMIAVVFIVLHTTQHLICILGQVMVSGALLQFANIDVVSLTW